MHDKFLPDRTRSGYYSKSASAAEVPLPGTPVVESPVIEDSEGGGESSCGDESSGEDGSSEEVPVRAASAGVQMSGRAGASQGGLD
eukprot:6471924-Amphidinium_carterae.1